MPSIKQFLTLARAKIEKPEHWTQGVLARTRYKNEIRPSSKQAYCFCMAGAVQSVTIYTPNDFQLKVMDSLREFLPCGSSIGLFNDSIHTSHSDVLAVFDKAIQNADS